MTKQPKPDVPQRFGQKKVTFAPSDDIDLYSDVAAAFMFDVLDLEPGDYLITDESTLRDFTFLGTSDTAPIWARIEEVYGLSQLDVASEHLLQIFAAIDRRSVAN